jgi:hemolysin III
LPKYLLLPAPRLFLDPLGHPKFVTKQPVLPVSGQSLIEEIVNSLTHGLGVLFGVSASTLLVFFATQQDDLYLTVGCIIFGVTVVLLYSASTLYHSLRGEKWKRVMQVLDHVAIYLLIAGTYTPYALGPLRPTWGWGMLALIWSLALLGSILEAARAVRSPGVSVALYLGMGWLAVITFPALQEILPTKALVFLIVGGSSYTIGTIFFLWDKLPFNHAIWHLFVLVGTISHFFSVLEFVAPEI